MQLLPRRLRSLHVARNAIAVAKLSQSGVERAAAFEATIVRRCGGADNTALERVRRSVAVANELGVFLALFLGQTFALDAICLFLALALGFGSGVLGAA